MSIQEKAAKLKFIKNNLEISIRLSETLQKIYQDPYLKKSMVLKGGTAIQCYLGDIKRLFFDLDLDFILDLSERSKFQKYLITYMKEQSNQELSPKSRFSYSLDSYRFPYHLENGNLNYLKLDINYSFHPHLYPIQYQPVKNPNFNIYKVIPLVHIEELMGMKIKALQDRGEIKDLFDIYQILNSGIDIDIKNVQNAYLFYMVLANCQSKIEKLDKITNITRYDEKSKLYPLIPKESHLNLMKMKTEVLNYVKECCILNQDQQKFIQAFQQGVFQPEYLFTEATTIENALKNPIANWKIKTLETKH